ncbi:winged helix DNA-binding domain-containing protein [Microbacterium sp. B35-30]|uniref:winged helix DNA-binding domain-containing protein n=1 Tax=Microbacterium sp. B35-30 TaxID=1962642 RepID=UPI0013D516B1|nr:winged helix DNA-binding domain-containing protein [Microbacterium sp. B35-30]KAF2418853.1 hypothetical protein B2K11_07385 [Microbacterium sp. B35-30]
MIRTPPPAAGASRSAGAASTIRHERLRSHRLSAPAPTIAEAARHMLATQAQEFWGGRWAIAARTTGRTTIRDVDAAFDRGEIVRSWTMRGTIHLIPAEDLAWVLSITADRQRRQAAAVHRAEGIDDTELDRAEAAVRAALGGGNRLTRKETFEVLERAGVSTVKQRGYHLLVALSLRGVICQGPVVARESGPTREQYLVLTDDWIVEVATPHDSLAEFFARFIQSHGPAGARDFAWWTGLPLGVARSAAEAASDRLTLVADEPEPQYVAATAPPRRVASAPEVVALPPFEEYYISYADRTVACAPEFLKAIGPSMNGIVRPIIVARGEIVGVWTHSVAVGRHADDPIPELFTTDASTDAEVAAALDRYRDFITADPRS